jgi:phosphatidylglycerophosphate synthase
MFLMLFNYSTFDFVDGKHARKTGQVSRLGELLDHGGDAFSDPFMTIYISQVCGFESPYAKIFMLLVIEVCIAK